MKRRFFYACLCLLLALSQGIGPGETFAGNAIRPCTPVIEPASESLALNWILLSPSPDGDRLLGLTLEDVKNTESDIFSLVVLDASGGLSAQTRDTAVSTAYWYDSDNILYFSHDSIEMKYGKGIIWNLKTDQKTRLLPWLDGGYQATCWDIKTQRLLFTVAESSGECVLYETVRPAAGEISVQTVTGLPFAPCRVFLTGNQSRSIWIEHPETHGLYLIEDH
jgi:hypothetical protein